LKPKNIARGERLRLFLDHFSRKQPFAETELEYTSPYELMVSVILSAQCTDKRVNLITPAFFRAFPSANDLARAQPEDVFPLIKSCSYPNNKAKNLVGMAKTLQERYGGVVPSDPRELENLPGIGRKSANVIASVVFNKPVLAVDTHVHRVAARIGLTCRANTPLQTEMQLTRYIPEKHIPLAHHWLLLHGRYVCKARKPLCDSCDITHFCKYFCGKKDKP
jgi:endonuclease-3